MISLRFVFWVEESWLINVVLTRTGVAGVREGKGLRTDTRCTVTHGLLNTTVTVFQTALSNRTLC